MNFYIAMIPPTATAQEKKVSVVNGKPVFYNPPAVKKAREQICAHLKRFKPDEPFEGALSLECRWHFPKGKSHKEGQWRTTRPDTDNLQKLLKDCMTQCDFWHDDAQVVREICEKDWSEYPGIYIEIHKLGECKNEQI